MTVHRQVMLDNNTVAGLVEAVGDTRARACAEIGSYLCTGSSVILGGLMAAADGVLYCVDPLDLDIGKLHGEPVASTHFGLAKQNVERLRLGKVIRMIRAKSEDAAPRIVTASLDLVYIDGDHSELAVRRDIALWLPKIRPGGVICGDDYCHAHSGGVKPVVDELFPDKSVRGRFWRANV